MLLGWVAPKTYATWNPSDKASDITLSSWNLLATQPNVHWSFVRSTIGKSSWKWYWETTVGTLPYNQVWVQDTNWNVNTWFAWQVSTWISYYWNNWNKFVNWVETTYWATFANWDIIGTALDMDSWTVEFFKNWVSQWVISGISWTTQYAANSIAGSTTLANFGATTFSYSPPSWYNAWLYS